MQVINNNCRDIFRDILRSSVKEPLYVAIFRYIGVRMASLTWVDADKQVEKEFFFKFIIILVSDLSTFTQPLSTTFLRLFF